MIASLLLLLSGPSTAVPPPADPLTATIHTEDADRFAALFARTGGAPTAEQLQREYLDPGSYGVHVFMDGRIGSAGHLAKTIAAKRALYDKAIRECLPVARATTDELRATYLAFRGLLPDRPLPQLYLVFGADSSGGTAGPGAQVLGLETLCGLAATPEALRATLRGFFAHETVHVFQADPSQGTNPLLASILIEGAADFVARLVSGRQMEPERAAWAAPRETDLWRQLEADLAVTHGAGDADLKRGRPAGTALHRWVGNYGDPPAGWPVETGYWMGQRIWERWYAGQPDKKTAIRRMLTLEKLDEVLAGGQFMPTSASSGSSISGPRLSAAQQMR